MRTPSVRFRLHKTGPASQLRENKTKEATPTKTETQPSRAAQMLALAHHIEQLIDEGRLKDYSEAARRISITRARMTQVANLLMLSPKIQEDILAGRCRLTERALRKVCAMPLWADQEAAT